MPNFRYVGSTLLGGAALAGVLALAGTPAAAVQAHPDFTGVWATEFREYVYTDDGKLPPIRDPAVLADYNMRVGKLAAGEPVLPDTVEKCLPHGTPRVMYTPFPMLIMQQSNVIALIFEASRSTRLIYMNEELPVDPAPTYGGHSVGRWHGSTLAIETVGMNSKIQIDRAGLPQSEHTRITERLSLVNDGAELEDKITVTDDTLYTAPWSFTVRYRKVNDRLMEYVCDNMRPDTG